MLCASVRCMCLCCVCICFECAWSERRGEKNLLEGIGPDSVLAKEGGSQPSPCESCSHTIHRIYEYIYRLWGRKYMKEHCKYTSGKSLDVIDNDGDNEFALGYERQSRTHGILCWILILTMFSVFSCGPDPWAHCWQESMYNCCCMILSRSIFTTAFVVRLPFC